MEQTYTFLWKKIIAWILVVCLVVTLIPELGYAVSGKNGNKPGKENTKTEIIDGKKVVDKKEETTTYKLKNGEYMSVFHGGRVRFEDESGTLTDYDASLTTISKKEKTGNNKSLNGYKYKNKTGDKKHYIPEQLSEETPIILENNEHTILMSPTDETLGQLKVNEAKAEPEKEKITDIYNREKESLVNAVYGDKSDIAGITYTSQEHGIKETIVLNEKPEVNTFEYKLNIGTLKAKENITDEGITFYDEETDLIAAYISAPWMNDASGQAHSTDITYELTKDGDAEGAYVLTMTVDMDYLNDESRQYPVTIDPTLTWTGSSQVKDVYVISGSTYGHMNFYESGTVVMPAGKNSQGTFETYMKFTDLGSSLSGKTITGAAFNAYENSGGAKDQQLSLYKAAGSWTASGICYNNRPGSTGSALDTVTSAKVTGKLHTFNILSYVEGVAAGNADYGLVLKNTTSTPSYASFYGSRSSAAATRPNLTVTYTETSSEASNVNISTAYVKNSTQATVSWQGLNSSDIARVEYKIVKYNDETQAEGEIQQDFSSDKTITPGSALPQLGDGCYKVYIRGVDTAGTAGTTVSAGVVHVDGKMPVAEKISVKDNSGNIITGKATTEGNPLIEFTSITDEHITSPFLTYAVTAKGVSPASSDYKSPTELSINSEKPFSGSFRLSTDYRSLPTGEYVIHVKSVDLAGNEFVKKLNYIKDLDDPTGSITITNLVTGVEISQIYEPVNIEIDVDGTGMFRI